MAFQEGESSGSKSTTSDSPNTPLPYNHPNIPSPAPQDPMNDLEHAYAALEIDDELFEGFNISSEKPYDSWLRAANRRAPSTAGRRWLVLEQGIHPETNLPVGVQAMGGGTVPCTTYTQTDIHGTGATANEHVSSVCTALPIESGSGTDISMQQANVEGLVVCDQKRPNKLQPLKHKLGYLGLFIVNSSGHKGGLALLWKEENQPADRIIWTAEDKGKYTVRSCYRILQGTMPESYQPLYFSEPKWSRQCWDTIGDIDYWNGQTFLEWMESNFLKFSNSKLCLLISVCWKIWEARNEKLWNHTVVPAHAILGGAQAFLYQWLEVNCSANLPIPATDQVIKWEKPPDANTGDQLLFVRPWLLLVAAVSRFIHGCYCSSELRSPFMAGS
nr:uncharacterized protein LOC109184133 isoform X1 [Ipomoea trifida]